MGIIIFFLCLSSYATEGKGGGGQTARRVVTTHRGGKSLKNCYVMYYLLSVLPFASFVIFVGKIYLFSKTPQLIALLARNPSIAAVHAGITHHYSKSEKKVILPPQSPCSPFPCSPRFSPRAGEANHIRLPTNLISHSGAKRHLIGDGYSFPIRVVKTEGLIVA